MKPETLPTSIFYMIIFPANYHGCRHVTELLRRGRCKSIQHNQSAGFTLVELLIAIVIVGILASLAVPSFREFIANQRIKTASFDIMSTLTLARSESIKRNADVAVIPMGGTWANGWSVTVAGTTLNQQSALPGLTIICKTGATTVACPAGGFTYENNGRVPSATFTSLEITSTSSTSIRCISIDLSGRPNSKVGACS